MRLFGSKGKCAVCGGGVDRDGYKLANKEWMCKKCFRRCGYTEKTLTHRITSETARNDAVLGDEYRKILADFKTTKSIGTFLKINDESKQFLISRRSTDRLVPPIILNYSDLVSYELLEDGEIVTEGGLSRAVAGGLLFGSTGAIVGGVTGKKKSKNICTSLQIKLTLNDINNPTVYIDLVGMPFEKSGLMYKSAYKTAQDCMSVFQLICSETASSPPQVGAPISSADEILKFKALLDSGIITPEEFDVKKKQLLDL